MGAPTVYYYDDPGAPVIGSAQDGFYQILRACLIDGYGAKPAAGWSVVYDDWAASGNFSIENAGQSGVLGLYRAAANRQPFMYIADAMTAPGSAVNGVSGRDTIANTATDFLEGNYYTQRPICDSLAPAFWCVVANENFAVVWLARSEFMLFSASLPFDNNDRLRACVAFGSGFSGHGLGTSSEPELSNFCIIGGHCTRGYFSASYINSIQWRVATEGGTAALSHIGAAPQMLALVPFFNAPSQYPSAAGLNFDIQMSCVSAYASSSTSILNGKQILLFRQLRSSAFFAGFGGNAFTLAGLACESLRGRVTFDGKPHLWGPVPGNGVLFVSLDASDWV